mmetsp:Transcript_896/g.2137  ORF Transcript_896/g.2137 Transcript_896/m.2137 type:complete len:509 (-) Transcript_896:92-1618(-)
MAANLSAFAIRELERRRLKANDALVECMRAKLMAEAVEFNSQVVPVGVGVHGSYYRSAPNTIKARLARNVSMSMIAEELQPFCVLTAGLSLLCFISGTLVFKLVSGPSADTPLPQGAATWVSCTHHMHGGANTTALFEQVHIDDVFTPLTCVRYSLLTGLSICFTLSILKWRKCACQSTVLGITLLYLAATTVVLVQWVRDDATIQGLPKGLYVSVLVIWVACASIGGFHSDFPAAVESPTPSWQSVVILTIPSAIFFACYFGAATAVNFAMTQISKSQAESTGGQLYSSVLLAFGIHCVLGCSDYLACAFHCRHTALPVTACTMTVFMFQVTTLCNYRKSFFFCDFDWLRAVAACLVQFIIEVGLHVLTLCYAVRHFNCKVGASDVDAHRFLCLKVMILLTKTAAEQVAIHGALAPMMFAEPLLFSFRKDSNIAPTLQSWAVQSAFEITCDVCGLLVIVLAYPLSVNTLVRQFVTWPVFAALAFSSALAMVGTAHHFVRMDNFLCHG